MTLGAPERSKKKISEKKEGEKKYHRIPQRRKKKRTAFFRPMKGKKATGGA